MQLRMTDDLGDWPSVILAARRNVVKKREEEIVPLVRARV
jgi:hypothetical protein